MFSILQLEQNSRVDFFITLLNIAKYFLYSHMRFPVKIQYLHIWHDILLIFPVLNLCDQVLIMHILKNPPKWTGYT